MLYSIGKDSAVMLHLARKAFYPAPPPFPLLHVDTTWKFREMIQFRDRMAAECGLDLIVHVNEEGVRQGVSPFTHGSALYTDVMKTEGLKQALDKYKFDAAFGGARRDEERSRAKERVFSLRDAKGQWDPKRQRPELWHLLNSRIAPGEHVRVFPLSNWTELDVWHYIDRERIPVVPLYFAQEREVIVRGNTLLVAEQPFIPLLPGERPQRVMCRMRSLGCSPCTGAIRSTADTVPKIIDELVAVRHSERQLRVIDHDQDGSMELKKREGYF
jgi:sulfate adenylyltransferase subunit 2